ncbi:hypothetical protein [Streptomyces sp. NRRL F-5123]|uniref:hypothetical protein n=1 Tax=Streptomyces sp. NRRL F-5123 TaxID=1463856 RepID=UPI0004E0C47E|nr:hypothetical protein [Streptomyces sp. NRRL F-5123]
MSTPQGPQDPRVPYQSGATPPVEPQQPQPGYGYPQGQYPPPVQPGYPHDVRQGFQQPFPYVPNPHQPDWSAVADRQEAERKRKKRLVLTIVIGVVVIALGAAGTVVALTMGGSKDKHTTATEKQQHTTSPPSSAPTSSTPKPSGTATPTLQGSDLFKATELPINGRTFTRKTTSHETPCWKGTQGGLGPILDRNHCSQIVLATYVSDKSSVTVGVIVLPTAAEAEAVATDFKGGLTPLAGTHGIPDFCNKVACAVTHAVHGRYVYTTIAGPNSGAEGDKDADSIAAGQGLSGYALSRLLEIH